MTAEPKLDPSLQALAAFRRDLPALADALADAGCDDDTLLGHLREPGIHHQGCLVLDAVLAG
jgi:hypothetical protein